MRHGHRLDAVARVDHDGGRLHRRQRRQCMAEKIRIARSVEQVNAGALRFKARHGELQRMPQRLFQRQVVAHGTAAFDLAGGGNRPGAGQQCFGKRGLPAPGLTDQCQCAKALNAKRTHVITPMRDGIP